MKLRFFYKKITKQFVKFCVVGATNTTLSYLSFMILFYYFWINYLLASAIAFILGTSFGFVFNKSYTFGSRKSSSITLPQYFLVYLTSVSFSLVSIKFLVDFIGFSPLLAMLLVNPIMVFMNFFGTKIIVFRNKEW